MAAGALGLLSKPFNLEQIQEKALSLLDCVTKTKARNLDGCGPMFV
jgi:hypothetical protein